MSLQNKGKPSGHNFTPQYQYGAYVEPESHGGEYNYPETSAPFSVPPGSVGPQGGPVRQLLTPNPAPQVPPPLLHPYGPHDMSKQPPQRQGPHQGHQGMPPNMPNVVNAGAMNVQNSAPRPQTNQPFVNSRNNTIRTMSNTRMPTPTPAPSALAPGYQSPFYMVQSPYEGGQIMLPVMSGAYPMQIFGQPRTPQPYFSPQQQQMFARHTYPPGPSATQQGLYVAQHTPSAPPREPVQEAPKRERKVLEILNPETNKSIWDTDNNSATITSASPSAASNGAGVNLNLPGAAPVQADARSKEATPTPPNLPPAGPADSPPVQTLESPAVTPAEEKAPPRVPVPAEKAPEIQPLLKQAEIAPPLHIEEPQAIATVPISQSAVPAPKEEAEPGRPHEDKTDDTISSKINGEVEPSPPTSPDCDGRGTQRIKGRKGGKSALSPPGVSAAAPKQASAQPAPPTVPEATPIPETAAPSPLQAATEVSPNNGDPMAAKRIEKSTPETPKTDIAEEAKTPETVTTPTIPVVPDSETESTHVDVEDGSISLKPVDETTSPEDEDLASKAVASNLPYSEDQWSPANPDGKKQYTRDFLMELQASAVAQKRPEDLPDLEVVRGAIKMSGGNMARKPFQKPFVDSFTPDFVAKSAGPNRGPMGKRPSQHGRDGGGGGGGGGGNMNMPPRRKELNVSLSLREKTKFQEVEGAWKPTYAQKPGQVQGQALEPEEAKTAELLKTVRGILNKLTPQKYDKLLEKLQLLPIDTPDRLAQVIKLFFDKAVDEPIFSPAYARICQQMSTKQASSSENVVTFRKLLLIRCQKEFEKDGTSLVELEEKRKQLEAEENEEKKKELESALNEMEAKNRRVTLGNIRFIGELFKLRMLTPRIMHSCVTRLLSTSDEESLECMCRLMSTIGKDLEQAGSVGGGSNEMNNYFQKLQSMTADMVKYSNRIRFMIQDLVELRQNEWKPRREDNNPKTIDQIHKEVEREREELEYQNAMTPSQPSGNMGGGRRGGGGGGGPGGNMDDRKRSRVGSNMPPGLADDGWSTVSKGKRDDFRQIKVPSMPSDSADADVNLGGSKFGPAKSFGQWQQGSAGFGSSSSVAPNRGGMTSGGGSLRPMGYMSSASMGPPMEGFNRYQALDDEGPPTFAPAKPANFGGRASTGGGAPAGRDYRSVGSTKSAILTDHKREGFHRGGTGYGSHGQQQPPFHQQQQHYQQREQHLQQDHLQQQRSQPPSRESSVPRMELKGPPSLTEDEAEKKTKAIVDEYINTEDLKEAVLSFSERFHHNTIASFVDLATNYKLDINDKERRLVGGLFRELIKQKLISKSKFLEGLSTLLATCDDYVVDMPRLWEYIAHIVGSVFMDGTLQLSVLEELTQPLVANNFSGKLVVAIFKEIAQQTSPSQLSKLWAASTPQLEKILRPGSRPEDLLKEQGLGYLVDGSASTQLNSSSHAHSWHISPELKRNLIQVLSDSGLKDKTSKVCSLVGVLSPEQLSSTAFVRALVTLVVESCLRGDGTNTKLEKEDLRPKAEIVKKFVDDNPELQLETLLAVQALWHARENPQAVLGIIFDVFYDENTVSEDAFRAWKDKDDPSDGKGVAVLNVTQFYTWLDEAEEDDDEEQKA